VQSWKKEQRKGINMRTSDGTPNMAEGGTVILDEDRIVRLSTAVSQKFLYQEGSDNDKGSGKFRGMG